MHETKKKLRKMNALLLQIFGKRFSSSMKISNSGKRSFLRFGRFKIGCVRKSNLKIPQLRQIHCQNIFGISIIRPKRSDSEGRNSTIISR